MLPFTHLSLRLLFQKHNIREEPERSRNILVSSFADEIRLRLVPARGISITSSCPGAEQPFLQGLTPLSDSSRRSEIMAMPARAFDFFKCMPLLSHCFIDRWQTSFCSSAKRPLQNALFVMWSPRWGWQRWTYTNPLFLLRYHQWILWIIPVDFFITWGKENTPLDHLFNEGKSQ